MRRKALENLSVKELEELRGFKEDLCNVAERSLFLALSLVLARESSARGVARERLLCVVQDCLLPAMRDLNSILREARRHAKRLKRRRGHAARGSGRHPR